MAGRPSEADRDRLRLTGWLAGGGRRRWAKQGGDAARPDRGVGELPESWWQQRIHSVARAHVGARRAAADDYSGKGERRRRRLGRPFSRERERATDDHIGEKTPP